MEKKKRTIIKCEDCGFKYYDGDVHLCGGVGGVRVGEKPKEKKLTVKTRKDSFKLWNGNQKGE